MMTMATNFETPQYVFFCFQGSIDLGLRRGETEGGQAKNVGSKRAGKEAPTGNPPALDEPRLLIASADVSRSLLSCNIRAARFLDKSNRVA
jgi:hypothetical protein